MTADGPSKRRKIKKLFDEQNGFCWICNMPMILEFDKKPNNYHATLDHIIPKSFGGTWHIKNLGSVSV